MFGFKSYKNSTTNDTILQSLQGYSHGRLFLLFMEHETDVDTSYNNDPADHPDDDVDGGVVAVISLRLTKRPHVMLCAAGGNKNPTEIRTSLPEVPYYSPRTQGERKCFSLVCLILFTRGGEYVLSRSCPREGYNLS